jgi:hypothetical protein
MGDRVDPEELPAFEGERCASARGVSLHANVAVPERDRRRLERLCRYVARPPLATDRLSRLPDRRLLYRLKHRWRDGTTHVVFEPGELIENGPGAAAALPPGSLPRDPRPLCGPRDQVVPRDAPQARPVAPESRNDLRRGERPALEAGSERRVRWDRAAAAQPPGDRAPAGATTTAGTDPLAIELASGRTLRARRLAWAALLRRVFAVDVLECPRCGGRMRLLATIHPAEATEAILECLGLPSRAPPTAPARLAADPDVGREEPFDTPA